MTFYGMILIMLALSVTILLSRYLMRFMVRIKCQRLLEKLSIKVEDIHFSFEELTYFISLPNRNPDFYDAKQDQFRTDIEFEGFIFPEIKGLMIELFNLQEYHQVAYMSLELLRIPILERWRYEKKISIQEYYELRAFILTHSNASKLFIEEVIRQIQRDDRILFIDEEEVHYL